MSEHSQLKEEDLDQNDNQQEQQEDKLETQKDMEKEVIISQEEETQTLLDYDPTKFPPNSELMMKHYHANQVGTIKSMDEFCPCCSKPCQKQRLSITTDINRLGFLGPLFPQYFRYLKYMMTLTLLMFLPFIHSMVSNIDGGLCDKEMKELCAQSAVVQSSLANSKDLNKQSIVVLITVILIMIANQVYFKYMRQNCSILDKLLDTPADYSIMISGLPQGKFEETDVVQLFDKFFDKKEHHRFKAKYDGVSINKINISYNIDTYLKKEKEKQKLVNKQVKNEQIKEKKGEYDQNYNKEELEKQLEEVDEELKTLIKQVEEQDMSNTTGVVIVTFNRQEINTYVLDHYKAKMLDKIVLFFMKIFMDHNKISENYPEYFLFKGQQLTIEQAPEPSDVQWTNLGIKQTELIKRRFISLFLQAVVLAISFLIILGVYHGQENIISEEEMNRIKKSGELEDRAKFYAISFIGSFIIVVVNFLLMKSTSILSRYQRMQTSSQMQALISQRLSIAQFINTAILIIIVELRLKERDDFVDFVKNIVVIFFSNGFVSPTLNVLNVFHLIRLIKRRKAKNPKSNKFITQQQAHQAFDGAPLFMEYKYSLVFKTLLMTAFYIPLEPMIAIITLLALFFNYAVEKYLLLNRYQEPKLISSRINRQMSQLLDYLPLVMTIGQLVFKASIYQGQKRRGIYLRNSDEFDLSIDFIALAVSCINFIVPSLKLNKLICQIDQSTDNEISYDDARLQFNDEYDRSNPITQQKGYADYFDYQQKKGLIDNAEELKQQQQEQTNVKDLVKIQTQNVQTTNFINLVGLGGHQRMNQVQMQQQQQMQMMRQQMSQGILMRYQQNFMNLNIMRQGNMNNRVYAQPQMMQQQSQMQQQQQMMQQQPQIIQQQPQLIQQQPNQMVQQNIMKQQQMMQQQQMIRQRQQQQMMMQQQQMMMNMQPQQQMMMNPQQMMQQQQQQQMMRQRMMQQQQMMMQQQKMMFR